MIGFHNVITLSSLHVIYRSSIYVTIGWQCNKLNTKTSFEQEKGTWLSSQLAPNPYIVKLDVWMKWDPNKLSKEKNPRWTNMNKFHLPHFFKKNEGKYSLQHMGSSHVWPILKLKNKVLRFFSTVGLMQAKNWVYCIKCTHMRLFSSRAF